MYCKWYSTIADIPASLWNGLFATTNPFVQHAFLLALENSGCATAESGWRPRHILLMQGEQAMAAMPMYSRSDSYGEFVFDWSWAEAYQRYGLEYYPKLTTAVPFSPVCGPRLGLAEGMEMDQAWRQILPAIQRLCLNEGYSSWHVLFPDIPLQDAIAGSEISRSLLQREAVQFHWFNRDYQCFDDFLGTMRSSRRKNIKRERRRIAEQGLSVQRKIGVEISDEEWHGFYQCYVDTYRKRSGHDGYLNRRFFDQLRACMPDQLLLVVARKQGAIIASSLFLHDRQRLYGRYWGALQDISCLHFELCFYQGIEFCIEQGLVEFDPGTQGEHKLMRGFEPFRTLSFHWIADPRFRDAIAAFTEQESQHTQEYKARAAEFLPFRK